MEHPRAPEEANDKAHQRFIQIWPRGTLILFWRERESLRRRKKRKTEPSIVWCTPIGAWDALFTCNRLFCRITRRLLRSKNQVVFLSNSLLTSSICLFSCQEPCVLPPEAKKLFAPWPCHRLLSKHWESFKYVPFPPEEHPLPSIMFSSKMSSLFFVFFFFLASSSDAQLLAASSYYYQPAATYASAYSAAYYPSVYGAYAAYPASFYGWGSNKGGPGGNGQNGQKITNNQWEGMIDTGFCIHLANEFHLFVL